MNETEIEIDPVWLDIRPEAGGYTRERLKAFVKNEQGFCRAFIKVERGEHRSKDDD